MSELEEAIDRVILGPERKSRVINDRERRLKAFHEVGHALVAKMLPEEDTVYKLTIVARGIAGGYTSLLPEEDRTLTSRVQAEARLAFSLGGRTAEEIVFGEVTTGAIDDLERATELARRMVTQWGMSSKLGPRTFGKKEELVFLGRDISETRNYSEATALLIDQEISNLIAVAHDRARVIIAEHRDKIDEIAERLLEVETLDSEAFHAMFDGESPASDQADSSADEVSEAEAEPEEQPKQQPRPMPAPS
jgi:cell division protease FtsH